MNKKQRMEKFSKPIVFQGFINKDGGHYYIHAPFFCVGGNELAEKLILENVEWKISYRVI